MFNLTRGTIDKAHVIDLHTLASIVRDNGNPVDMELLERAYDVSDLVHETQKRRETCEDGTRLSAITHPRRVALMLANLGYPDHVVGAFLLHDCKEDAGPEINPDLNEIFGTIGKSSHQIMEGFFDTRFSAPIVGMVDAVTNPFRTLEKEDRKDKGYLHFLKMAPKFPYAIPGKGADRKDNFGTFSTYLPKDRERNLRETTSLYLPLLKTVDTVLHDQLRETCETYAKTFHIDSQECRPYHYQKAIQALSTYAGMRGMVPAGRFVDSQMVMLMMNRQEVWGMMGAALKEFEKNTKDLYLPNRADRLDFPAEQIGDFLHMIHCREAIDQYFMLKSDKPNLVRDKMELGYETYDIPAVENALQEKTGSAYVETSVSQTLFGEHVLNFNLNGTPSLKARDAALEVFNTGAALHIADWYSDDSRIILDLVTDPLEYCENGLPGFVSGFGMKEYRPGEGVRCPEMPFVMITTQKV